jgi:hypothetical protein
LLATVGDLPMTLDRPTVSIGFFLAPIFVLTGDELAGGGLNFVGLL